MTRTKTVELSLSEPHRYAHVGINSSLGKSLTVRVVRMPAATGYESTRIQGRLDVPMYLDVTVDAFMSKVSSYLAR